MIKVLLENKMPWLILLIHVILGVSSTLSPIPVIVWFYLVIFSSLHYLLKKTPSPILLIATILYLVSFELLARMARTSPFIPYELGKYLLLAGMVWAILMNKTIGYLGWVMLICLIPAVFIDVSGIVSRDDLVFNLLGPVNVALVVIVFYKQKISLSNFSSLIRLMIYPIIGVLAFTFIKSPEFDQVEFSLGANSDWSGGFGSNQVSTLFGLGALMLFILMINRWKFSGFFILDAVFLFGFVFQGLLTFSRGGMLGAVVGIFIILFYLRTSEYRERQKYNLPKVGKYVLPAIFFAASAYIVVDELTGGMLSLRYAGETAGTLQGSKIKSFNTVTTGRLDIFLGDVDLWLDHFFFGVGAGASGSLRETMEGAAAHVELSRLLAEHGLLGLIYFVVLCWLGFKLLRENPNPMVRGILVAFFTVAIYTTFHAAMRTFVSPALIGLSLLAVNLPKTNPVKRKPQGSSKQKVLVRVK
ncbi:O-antigen ligase family protein [Algoriphagus taiwanensis]|uniref:O-antigen ligase family protein n=1 Tax=Algoriphagus taiwanensis TaxID=1445656 RepID=A0ABQ6Q289_9BACT|nr:O-antigen ligase family protein [Algoriphagus taiwanensis]